MKKKRYGMKKRRKKNKWMYVRKLLLNWNGHIFYVFKIWSLDFLKRLKIEGVNIPFIKFYKRYINKCNVHHRNPNHVNLWLWKEGGGVKEVMFKWKTINVHHILGLKEEKDRKNKIKKKSNVTGKRVTKKKKK